MTRVNPLLLDTSSPPIPLAQGWARRYAGTRGPLIDLAQAVPGYPPHPEILEALAAAASSPLMAGYGAILGDQDLRDRYAAHVGQTFDTAIRPGEVAITSGCNQAFFVAVLALAKAGEAIILPTPWYFNHKMTLDMLGIEARAVPASAEDGFVPDPDRIAAAIDERVRAVVLISPNNPTGAVYPPETLAAIFRVCRERGVALVLDETYRDFLADAGTKPHGLFDDPDWRDTLVELYSFSKSFCIPGHRLGAVIAGEEFLAEFAKVMDCVQICAPRAGQHALAATLEPMTAWREENRREIIGRAAAFRQAAGRLDGWRLDAIGAYFAFLRHPFDAKAADVAERLAVDRGVLCLPGSYFGPGNEHHLRIAFANADRAAIESLPDRFLNLTTGWNQ
ncbi:aspartate/tyrosine/aromatic aminotransferase [Skermanella stibiiresistens SB22]|uniref:aspartate transaminase n=1 Tax=Skermanella stibiiresistens SB22 TaxID=1385369 RepID=W9H838_9PROT|nr:aminotransferase [Skermanella stibiiresistens]EWY42169.1 aspartate/tyrosine/aromatic aminotransferase [Skermanella stibiiresistens SB22]